MKKIKLILLCALTLLFAVNLTACSSPENGSSKEDGDSIMAEGDKFFAMPTIDGKPLTKSNAKEIRLMPFDDSLLYGVTIDMSKLDYTIKYIFDSSVAIQMGEQEYEFFFDRAEFMLDSEEPDEIIDDIKFCYYDYSVCAYVEYNDVAVCISSSYDSVETAPMDTIKENIQSLSKRMTFEEIEAGERFATAYDFNGVKFDCGWQVANVTKADRGVNNLSFRYEDETIYMEAYCRIEEAENVEYFAAPENSDQFHLEPLLDESGNEIGYIDLGTESENNSSYLIRLEDGSYMDIEIVGTDSSDATFPHDWEAIERILNSGN